MLIKKVDFPVYLDIDFSAVNYKSVASNNTQIKEFHPITKCMQTLKIIGGISLGICIPGIGSIVMIRRKIIKDRYKESIHQKARTR